ncbi:MAG: hypothetical protein IKG18_06095 [Atopobiaceae bacterium]|nr:hypothetical protein [Atopobiaceae bacterium]
MDARVVAAHSYSANNKPMLRRDKSCGCFYCLRAFNPSEIVEWIEDKSGTALCPYYGIDSDHRCQLRLPANEGVPGRDATVLVLAKEALDAEKGMRQHALSS